MTPFRMILVVLLLGLAATVCWPVGIRGTVPPTYWRDTNASLLRVYYNFETIVNTTNIIDSSGNSRTATFSGGTVYARTNQHGRIDHNYYLNGASGDTYKMPAATIDGMTNYSICFWAYMNGYNVDGWRPILTPTTQNGQYWRIMWKDNSWWYHWRILSGYGIAAGDKGQGAWRHWVITGYKPSNSLRIWIDGVSYNARDGQDPTITANGPWYWATESFGPDYVTMYLDEVRVYSKALSSNEVFALFQNTCPTNNLVDFTVYP